MANSKLTHRVFLSFLLAFASILVLSLFSQTTVKAANVTVSPTELTGVLLNPGKGWVLYDGAGNLTTATAARVSTGYGRFNWISIEPSEGVYDWSPIDNQISALAAYGIKQYAFGIMADNTCDSGQYITPKWVFDAGAASTTGWVADCNGGKTRTTPVWNDPIFLAKYRGMLTALAARYDGSPNIAYIDIRSYGNWGEMDSANYFPGSVNISDADYRNLHVQMFLDEFSKTPTIAVINGSAYNSTFDWAVTQGIGMRRDGIPDNSNGSELARAYGNSPAIMEWTGSWAAYQWSTTALADAATTAKASFECMGGFGSDAVAFLTAQQPFIDAEQNRLGYHFVLTSATLPDTISNGTVYPTSLTWNNKGLNYSYEPMRLAYGLLDSSNNVIAKYFPDTGANPQRLAPGVTTETPNLVFSGVPTGTYKLAVGIFKDTSDANPLYNLAITGKTSNGWYPLLNSVAVSGGGTFAAYPKTYETEFITPTFPKGRHNIHVRDVNLSSGMGDRFNAGGVGQSISYPVNVTQTGTMDVKVKVKQEDSGGNYQLAIDGVNQGPVMYTYAAYGGYAEYDLGNVTFNTTGVKQFTFTNVGTSVWGYTLMTDYILIGNSITPNLATGATVSSTSSVEGYGWGMAMVNDGERNTTGTSNGWTSNNSLTTNHTESLTLDMGASKTIGQLDLYPRNDTGNVGQNFPVDFTIQTSTDGTTWATSLTQFGYAQPGNAVQHFNFSAVSARYVKIEGTNLRPNPSDANNYRMAFAEVEIYNTPAPNLATGATVSSTSSVEGYGWGMAMVNDGERNTTGTSNGWTSNNSLTTNHTESLTLDMGTSKTIGQLDLYPRNDTGNVGQNFPVDFTIQTSTDGTTWATNSTQIGYAQPGNAVQRFNFSAVSARYVKIEGTNLRPNPNDANNYRMAFAEVEIYNIPAPGVSTNLTYKIVNRNSNKALQPTGGSLADGANIVQMAYIGANEQKWQFIAVGGGYYKIKNVNSGKLMDIYGASTADGANNIQWTDNGGVNQQWQLIDVGGYYKIKNVNSGKVLDIYGASTVDGAQDIQYFDNGGLNQQWQIAGL